MNQARLFREAAARANQGRDRTGWRYSPSLRRLAIEYCQSRREHRRPFREIAEALGVSTVTLGRWLESEREDPGPRLREVVIEESTPAPPSATPEPHLTVVTPSGLRIEGLDLSGVIELMRRVA